MLGKSTEGRIPARNLDIQELPPPSRRRGGSIKLLVVTFLALALTGGGLYWVTRGDDAKEEIKGRVLEKVNQAVQDTPLAMVTKYLTPPPPPPPPSVVNPRTEPGTLAGPVIQSTVPAPVDGSTDSVPPEENVVPKVEEDSVVRLDFVQDMARWLVARYHPVRGANLSVSALNMRYGVTMKGLSTNGGDVLSGRAALLRYVFNPAMLTALYGLYGDRFVEELGRAAAEPGQGATLTTAQIDAMYKSFAARFEALGGVLHGIAQMSDFSGRMEGLNKRSQQALQIHTQVTEAVFALDEAREAKNTAAMDAAQLRVNGLNAQYQRAMADRNTAQLALVAAIRQTAPTARGFDEDTIMFMANWLERRQGQNPHSVQSAATAARLLDDLAAKLRKAGSIAR